MKITLTFKTPDVINNGLDRVARLDTDLRDELYGIIENVLGSSEYANIEIDTETRSAKVL